MVEAYLDPAYNPLLDIGLTGDTDRLQDYTERLYCLSDPTLQQSWQAIRTAEPEPLRASLENAIAELTILGDRTLADLLRGSLSNIAEIAEVYSGVYENLLGIQGLPVPSLVSLLGNIDAWGEGLQQFDVRIMHDETLQFGPVIEQYFHHISSGRRGDIALPNGNIVRTGYTSLKHLRFVDSGRTPLVQAADVLAALLSTVLKTDHLATTERPSLVRLTVNVIAYWLLAERYPADIMGSNRFVQRVTTIIRQHSMSHTQREPTR